MALRSKHGSGQQARLSSIRESIGKRMSAPEQILIMLAQGLRLILETLSVLTVLVGLLAILSPLLRRGRRPASLRALRLDLGNWLSMALEFQLGADIVATTISPSGQQLLQLAAIALIRTFLNVFLARETTVERETP
jgi:uncharacterized membrane protein